MLRPFFVLLFLSFGFFQATAQDSLFATVYFPFNQTELSQKAKSQLDSLIQLTSKREVIYLRSEGHCDPVGSSAINQKISEERAQHVLVYLNKIGAKAVFQSTVGQGKRNLRYKSGKKGYPDLNRRVEITLGMRKIPPPKVDEEIVPEVVEAPEVPEPATQGPEDNKEPLFEEAELEVGNILVLEDINFFGGQSVILPESKAPLKRLLKLLQENPGLQIEIRGHVCCTSDMPLSKQRAKAIYKYLVVNGIRTTRLSFNGYNRQFPVANDETEAGRKANRRVDIKVVAN